MQIVSPNINLPFIEKRRPFIIASVIMVVAALILPFVLPPNWGTSFRGGSTMLIHFEEEVSIEEVRTAFTSIPELSDAAVQAVSAQGGKPSAYMIKTAHTTTLGCERLESFKKQLPVLLAESGATDVVIDAWPACKDEGVRGDFFIRFAARENVAPAEPPADFDSISGVDGSQLQQAAATFGLDSTVTFEPVSRRFVVKPLGLQADVTKMLVQRFGDRFDAETGFDEVVTVGADVGEKFRSDGIVSLLFAIGLIMIYVAIRFDMRYSPGGVVALTHDAIITFGFIVLSRLEITLETVAAILAIVGYSINDTIVIFDRIREIVRSGCKDSIEVCANRGINATLSRTVLTSGTTILAMLPLVFIAQGVIRDFAIVMVFGILIGTWSSLFVATPSMLYLDAFFAKRKERLAVQRRLDEASASSSSEG
ncbi:MAG: protein translocase subunit SecF [Myxococcota bacterium]|jgi:preprotein translocase subunit SecF|nr:protein translocase subunit SecF [Myxococcota bacterium]